MAKKNEEHTHFGLWILLIGIIFCLLLNFYYDGKSQDRITEIEVDREIKRTQNTRPIPITKNVTFIFDLDKKVWNSYGDITNKESIEIYGCYVTEFLIEKFDNKLLCVNWMGCQDISNIEGKNIWEESPYLLEHKKCDYLFSYFDGSYYMENITNLRVEFDCSLNSAGEIIKFTLVDKY